MPGRGTLGDSLQCFAAFRTIAALGRPLKIFQHSIASDAVGALPRSLRTHAVTDHVDAVPPILAEIVFVVGSYAADIRACCDFDAQAHRNVQLNLRPAERRELQNS